MPRTSTEELEDMVDELTGGDQSEEQSDDQGEQSEEEDKGTDSESKD